MYNIPRFSGFGRKRDYPRKRKSGNRKSGIFIYLFLKSKFFFISVYAILRFFLPRGDNGRPESLGGLLISLTNRHNFTSSLLSQNDAYASCKLSKNVRKADNVHRTSICSIGESNWKSWHLDKMLWPSCSSVAYDGAMVVGQ